MNTTAEDGDMLVLAERMRQAVGDFVRATRAQAETPSTARAETLGLLDRAGPMSTAALAEQRKVKHQSMRLVVAQLEEAGLVERAVNPHDGRSRLVALTGQGRAALVAERRARAEWLARTLRERLSAEERCTLATAVDILKKIAAIPAA